jgi:hypothetical protein
MDITSINSKSPFKDFAQSDFEIQRIRAKVRSSDFIERNRVYDRNDTFTKMDGTKVRIVIYSRNGLISLL